jgi:sugar lactone lactonase YvrE
LYITETSQTFQRRRIFHAIFDGRPNGRLLRYTKDEEGEGTVRVVANNLFMPNGITLSHSKSELLIVCGVTIQRYSLTKQRMLPSDNAFARVLPGSGDNIRMMKHLPTGDAADCYWVGLGSKFAQPFSLLKLTSEMPWLKSFLIALLPYSTIVDLIPKLSALAIYDTDGELIELYQDESGVFPWVSEGESFDNYLYLGSWYNNGLARVRMDENQ